MSEARNQILTTLRRNLKRGPAQGELRQQLEARLNQPQSNLIPARAQLPRAEQIELFVTMAHESAATLQRVKNPEEIPQAISAFVAQQQQLPADIVLAPAQELADLPWQTQKDLRIHNRQVQNGDKITVAPAFAGIAETGTLMLLSGPDSPTSLNFLPDIHIVILSAETIVGTYEDAFTRLRECRQRMPRTVNMITGPSRSADIEQTLQLGAHGPIQVHIILLQPDTVL